MAQRPSHVTEPGAAAAPARRGGPRAALALALAALALAGCGGTPGEDRPETGPARTDVRTDGFGRLGPVTLEVVSSEGSGGPREAMEELTESFERRYPNVDVQVSFRDFSGWIKQVKLALAADDPPDVVAGNQGYQVDGELVRAGLIRDLSPHAEAYGWDESFSDLALQQFKWSEDGRAFGEGAIWGVGQYGQSTGAFANLAKLREAGVDPAVIETYEDFEAALARLRDALPSGEPVIMLGNREQYPAIHLWGSIQGAFVPAQEVRDWIFHRDGSTFATEGNVRALERLVAWDEAGYLGRFDDYNGRGEVEAANLFARGRGAFMIGGTWNAQAVRDGLGEDAAFFSVPPGESGSLASIGAASVPYHVSSRAEHPDLAAAYIDHVTRAEASEVLVSNALVPAVVGEVAEPRDELTRDVAAEWEKLVEAGGLTLFPDWSSPTMLETLGRGFQEMLAGRASPEDVARRAQEDWERYHRELGQG